MTRLHIIPCACGHQAARPTGEINRAARKGAPLYCSRACAGLARRDPNPPTEAERKAAKAAYDAVYRQDPARKARKQAQARERHLRTYDPVQAAIERKANMARHVAYCRRPEYRAKKAAYDRRHLAEKHYGAFAAAALILRDIETEVAARMTRQEVYAANGTQNKWIQRRRDYDRSRQGA